MNNLICNSKQIAVFSEALENWAQAHPDFFLESTDDQIGKFKKGNKIHIKKENKGKFTSYCGGKVTSACIAKGKNSSDPAIRKRATFAANARTWKHQQGGVFQKIFK